MQQPHDIKYDIHGPHSSTLLLDDSEAHTKFSINTNNNERLLYGSFYFTGIVITNSTEVNDIAPILLVEEVAKITHDPKLLTIMKLEEKKVVYLPRHPFLEAIKVTHEPIHPTGLHLDEYIVAVIQRHSFNHVKLPLKVVPHKL